MNDKSSNNPYASPQSSDTATNAASSAQKIPISIRLAITGMVVSGITSAAIVLLNFFAAGLPTFVGQRQSLDVGTLAAALVSIAEFFFVFSVTQKDYRKMRILNWINMVAFYFSLQMAGSILAAWYLQKRFSPEFYGVYFERAIAIAVFCLAMATLTTLFTIHSSSACVHLGYVCPNCGHHRKTYWRWPFTTPRCGKCKTVGPFLR